MSAAPYHASKRANQCMRGSFIVASPSSRRTGNEDPRHDLGRCNRAEPQLSLAEPTCELQLFLLAIHIERVQMRGAPIPLKSSHSFAVLTVTS